MKLYFIMDLIILKIQILLLFFIILVKLWTVWFRANQNVLYFRTEEVHKL